MAFEAGGLFLGDAEKDDAFFRREASALLGSDGVLLLPTTEMDDRDGVLVGEGIDGVDEALEQRPKQGW